MRFRGSAIVLESPAKSSGSEVVSAASHLWPLAAIPAPGLRAFRALANPPTSCRCSLPAGSPVPSASIPAGAGILAEGADAAAKPARDWDSRRSARKAEKEEKRKSDQAVGKATDGGSIDGKSGTVQQKIEEAPTQASDVGDDDENPKSNGQRKISTASNDDVVDEKNSLLKNKTDTKSKMSNSRCSAEREFPTQPEKE
ncbi:hypothetical protein Y032_0075g947 [Ancylostoma ceylanicum]|uniref:Uncharacterized protein n=1 Tax=Ancylostoma ceylanicum TaxID=53326 RepID=A0A016TUU7_9BILA|nr:hypothetical protein Y032_0075g947 [Ancylostoma ceylanicum]